MARFKGAEVAYLHADHLGSPVAATDETGAILWAEHFTPYGENIPGPAANPDDEGFTGHIQDTDTGLTYMQARYYDPVIGRFLSNDPVGFAEGGTAYFNRYAYTANDPVNFIDPTGENTLALCAGGPITCGVGAAIFVVGAVVIVAEQNGVFDPIDDLVNGTVDNIMNSDNQNDDLTEGTRELGDLKPMDWPAHTAPRPALEGLSDEDLLDSVMNPDDRQKVKVTGDNDLRDGNGRILEMKKRGFPPDTQIPVEELLDDPIAPWEN